LNGNPALLNFWLLADLLYRPILLEEVRAESAKAFIDGPDAPPDMSILQNQCPVLNAVFYEGLRLHGGATTVRRVCQDTQIGGYNLKPGADVMVPYRELLLNAGTWGENAETFDHTRFLLNPSLSSNKFFKPFGGGTTYFPGRMLARQVSLAFLATAFQRLDFEVVGGTMSQRFPRMNEAVPTAGILSPHIGDDIRVKITKRLQQTTVPA
jgi:cytochrome P450